MIKNRYCQLRKLEFISGNRLRKYINIDQEYPPIVKENSDKIDLNSIYTLFSFNRESEPIDNPDTIK